MNTKYDKQADALYMRFKEHEHLWKSAAKDKFFKSKDFILKRTKGSHMILIKKLSFGNQILVIPRHKVVPRGTLNAIYKQAMRFISEPELFDKFYSK